MSCNPSFTKAFPLACLQDLVSMALKGEFADWKTVVRKATWSLGCIVTYMNQDEIDDTIVLTAEAQEDLATYLDAELNRLGEIRASSFITPELLKAIVEFLFSLLADRMTSHYLATEEEEDED